MNMKGLPTAILFFSVGPSAAFGPSSFCVPSLRTPPSSLLIPRIAAPLTTEKGTRRNSWSYGSSSTETRALVIDSAQEGNWKAYLDDEKTGLVFYHNSKTGESQWYPPSESFPHVQLNVWMEERMVEVRNAYFQSLEKDGWYHFNRYPGFGSLEKVNNFMQRLTDGGKNEGDIGSDAPVNGASLGTIGSEALQSEVEYSVPFFSNTSQTDAIPVSASASGEENPTSANPFIKSLSLFQKNNDQTLGFSNNSNGGGGSSNNNDDDDEDDVNSATDTTASKFTFAQKIESTKAGIIGLISGGATLIPFAAFHSFVSDTSINPTSQFAFNTVIGSVESALFAIVYRYCVRDGEETNEMLGMGVVGAFAITRALSLVSAGNDLGEIDLSVLESAAWATFESLAIFGVVQKTLEQLVKKGFLSRME